MVLSKRFFMFYCGYCIFTIGLAKTYQIKDTRAYLIKI